MVFGQDLEDKEPAWKHLEHSIPDSTANAKALSQELAEHVLRSVRKQVWPEGSDRREGKNGT